MKRLPGARLQQGDVALNIFGRGETKYAKVGLESDGADRSIASVLPAIQKIAGMVVLFRPARS